MIGTQVDQIIRPLNQAVAKLKGVETFIRESKEPSDKTTESLREIMKNLCEELTQPSREDKQIPLTVMDELKVCYYSHSDIGKDAIYHFIDESAACS